MAAQVPVRGADLAQAKAALLSNERAAEAERRTKSVLESQDLQLVILARRKRKISSSADGNVGERQVRVAQ